MKLIDIEGFVMVGIKGSILIVSKILLVSSVIVEDVTEDKLDTVSRES